MSDSTDRNPIAQTCYEMAYFVLPRYAFGETAEVVRELSLGRVGAAFFYVLTCKMGGGEPDKQATTGFDAHHRVLSNGADCYVVAFPEPPAIDTASIMEAENPLDAMNGIVLAPYFSALVHDRESEAIGYFVLGQSPDGFTTLRMVTPEANSNLGRGSEPQLNAFLDLLDTRLGPPAESS